MQPAVFLLAFNRRLDRLIFNPLLSSLTRNPMPTRLYDGQDAVAAR